MRSGLTELKFHAEKHKKKWKLESKWEKWFVGHFMACDMFHPVTTKNMYHWWR